MKKLSILYVGLALSTLLPAQYDTTNESGMLLMDMRTQIEITTAVNKMYNFEFDQAEKEFGWLQQKFPEHPLPYFLKGLSYWWRILPNVDEESNDDIFLNYMDVSIEKADAILDEKEDDPEAIFFLAAAYGFKGRLYSERKSWRKATFAGKNAVNYMNEGRDNKHLSPEFLFGNALFNYYAEWIPEHYPLLGPVVALFPDGSKKKGLEQLKTVANNAFYTRTEAQTFLMKIYANDYSNDTKALYYAEYLVKNFPSNPYFNRYLARLHYSLNNYKKCEEICKKIIENVEAGKEGYGENTGRYAAFYLGWINEYVNKNPDAARYFYVKNVMYTEAIEKEKESHYYVYSLSALANLEAKRGKKDRTSYFFYKVLKAKQKDHPSYDEARAYFKDEGWKTRRKAKAMVEE